MILYFAEKVCCISNKGVKMEKYFDLMLSTPLFHNMDKNELSLVLSCLGAQEKVIAKGEPAFLEGDPTGAIGMVLDGSVQIVRDDFYGSRSLIAQADAGELFAEAFACAGISTMPVSAYAKTDSIVLMMDHRKMLTVCSNSCPFHNLLIKNLLQVVAQKNLALSGKIRLMSQKTTKEKLMAYLLEQAKLNRSAEFTIPLDRQALADYLGVERSAMSTELGKLKKDGIIDFKGPDFKINR